MQLTATHVDILRRMFSGCDPELPEDLNVHSLRAQNPFALAKVVPQYPTLKSNVQGKKRSPPYLGIGYSLLDIGCSIRRDKGVPWELRVVPVPPCQVHPVAVCGRAPCGGGWCTVVRGRSCDAGLSGFVACRIWSSPNGHQTPTRYLCIPRPTKPVRSPELTASSQTLGQAGRPSRSTAPSVDQAHGRRREPT